jgi:cell division protein FtsW (lipid II flippase)
MRFLMTLIGFAARGDWLRTLIIFLLPVVLVEIYSTAVGGREALFIGGARVHLPTLFLPVFVMVTALVVTAIDGRQADRARVQWRALAVILSAVLLYYLSSHFDHGGTALLGAGVLVSAWMASRETRPVTVTAVTAGLIVVAVLLAVFVFHQERFELAWGGEEGTVRYFDEAVNLRTARDMARAGGLTGLYDQLYIPGSVATNIYNDLAAAYLTGFFGFTGLLLVALSYALFYSRLLRGTLGLTVTQGDGKRGQAAATAGSVPKPTFRRGKLAQGPGSAVPGGLVRHVAVAYAASIIVVFCLQTFWVLSATLNRWVPISGLDLQPISASVISVLGFVGMLLGSVALAHNISRPAAGLSPKGARPAAIQSGPPRPVMRRRGEPQVT